MKKLYIILIVISILVLFTSCKQPKTEYIILDDEETFSNDNYSDSNSEKQLTLYADVQKMDGYLSEIVKEAFKRVGYNVQIEYMPWARALESVMNGSGTGLVGVYYSDARALHMVYSDPIGYTEYRFFKLSDSNIDFNSLESLEGYVIGIQRGVSLYDEFNDADYLTKESADNPEDNIEKLINGRIDLFLEQSDVVTQIIDQLYPDYKDSIVALNPPAEVKNYYLSISNQYPEYQTIIADFNLGLQILKEENKIDEIISNYTHP